MMPVQEFGKISVDASWHIRVLYLEIPELIKFAVRLSRDPPVSRMWLSCCRSPTITLSPQTIDPIVYPDDEK
jgi:hypothetical protein